MVITTVGLLAAAQLIVVGVRLQTESRDATAANALARAKIEELENYPPTAAQRVRGGSLTTNVTGYNDSPDVRFRRRWLVETSPADAGVPSNTQRITVVIVADRGGIRLPPVQVAVLAPTS
jgi:hypothetical protein